MWHNILISFDTCVVEEQKKQEVIYNGFSFGVDFI
jgi:hypothetical protein